MLHGWPERNYTLHLIKQMRFLADMGISKATVDWLQERGFEADHVRDYGMSRALDTEIICKARKGASF